MIKFGATVTLADEDTDEERPTRSSARTRPTSRHGRLSVTSPLARALIGKTVGDIVEVPTPGGSKTYEVVKVEFR